MEAQTQSLALSKNIETEGFDLQAGQTWTYPTNYPIRDYQYNIIHAALSENTLVSLPTGLGKTFIASVVMYNFYRWYPHGKIIFMAPTRPLVKQQIEACYNIMAIPAEVTAELTGTKVSSTRADIWLLKRVFFVTPQVLQNDLDKVAQLGGKIKCLVFDEAHKARGNHAYCQVISKLLENHHKYFRVLALSATPGGNINDVAEVVNNLLISHLEFRTEESVDVHPYVFQRSLETVVVHLGDKLAEVKDEYMKIVEYYARTLMQHNVIQGNCAWLTKGKIFMLMKDFQNKNKGQSSSNYSEIMRCLNICVTLYHALELLIRHGLRNFLSFFDEHIEKPLLRGNTHLRAILENVRTYLGPVPQVQILPDGTYPEIPNDIKFGHPKHYKLRDILNKHFSKENQQNSRVMVFFEYRESVLEAHTLLLQSRPVIRPSVFLGQGSGITQKTQLGVIRDFKEGKCNTLLSTCIGEEGLDIGEVDLIVCFDISNKSPIRMVQRMGRTGRKREGSVLVLVTEGKEQQTLKDCLIHKNNISTHVLGSSYLRNNLYPNNPRLIPADVVPTCQRMFITVKEKPKKNAVIDTLKQHSSRSAPLVFSQSSATFTCQDLIPDTKMRSTLAGNPLETWENNPLFNRHIERMRTSQKVCLIEHSKNCVVLNELLCYADSKRFNIPITAEGKFGDFSGKALKQGDIRSMFLKEKRPASKDDFAKSNEVRPQSEAKADEISRCLSNYAFEELFSCSQHCSFCPQGFECCNFDLTNTSRPPRQPIVIPNEAVIQQIMLQDIEEYTAIIDGYRLAQDLDAFPTLSQFESSPEAPKETKIHSFEAPQGFLQRIDTFIQEEEEEIGDELVLDFFKLQSYGDMFEPEGETVIYERKPEHSHVGISDMCDLAYYGLTEQDLADFEARGCDSLGKYETLDAREEGNSLLNQNLSALNPGMDASFCHEFDEDATPLDIVPPPDEPNQDVSITQLVNLLNQTQTKSRAPASSPRRSLNTSGGIFSDSDDDFEDTVSSRSRNVANARAQQSRCPTQKETGKIGRRTPAEKHSRKSKRKPKHNEFLDTQAEVSYEKDVFISDDEDETIDGYEISFVNNKTQHFNTEVHGMYLRSIKSFVHQTPLLRHRPLKSVAEVYSQIPPTEPDDYLEDTFCVDAPDEELTQASQLSELSILEEKLQRKGKNKPGHCIEPHKPKRRRIKILSSDDSE